MKPRARQRRAQRLRWYLSRREATEAVLTKKRQLLIREAPQAARMQVSPTPRQKQRTWCHTAHRERCNCRASAVSWTSHSLCNLCTGC